MPVKLDVEGDDMYWFSYYESLHDAILGHNIAAEWDMHLADVSVVIVLGDAGLTVGKYR